MELTKIWSCTKLGERYLLQCVGTIQGQHYGVQRSLRIKEFDNGPGHMKRWLFKDVISAVDHQVRELARRKGGDLSTRLTSTMRAFESVFERSPNTIYLGHVEYLELSRLGLLQSIQQTPNVLGLPVVRVHLETYLQVAYVEDWP